MPKGAVTLQPPRTFVMAFAIIFFLSSCAGTRLRGRDVPSVYITDAKKVQLLPPRQMNGSLDELQFFSASFAGQGFCFQSYIQADKKGLSLTILNEMGMEMGDLRYTDSGLSFSSGYFPQSLKAEYMLMDLQNCYYDLDALKECYASAGLELSSSCSGSTETRLVKDGETVIEEITIERLENNAKSIRLKNSLRSYSYEIRTMAE